MHVLRTQMESFHNGHCRPARCARTVSSDTDGEQHSQSRFELHVFHGPGGVDSPTANSSQDDSATDDATEESTYEQ